MIKDLPEGQTHYYNDGCGEPEHNTMDWKQKIREDYKDILSPEIIDKTIEYWSNFLSQKAAEIEKEINRVFDYNSLDKNKILEIIRQILK